ncbi:enoyl-CoA hydratase [Pseudomonas aeruginosa]|uniref:Enoyl-CoA hydratase n=1 Tax=Pseudomonas aeruginosa TaxID=287 RepID=A0A6A9JT05_PSEAI|nr:enoyl-CoA hydratase [Pseudomonas aeruginosa]MBV5796756.1 enoyl-CoA hydratase [Pseudomonas aeruginosa]MDG3711683.1 enoyl-CoA hydratase [Pseudomonas aeruginosa]MDG3816271.1 enoyl-CoA hydratase [Pseudomonas aeruginosa]MUI56806.1 enoyl-CoA hydratase [Pseudomonas aeruginosa]RCM88016.1 1,4-Dihydroxy-2-naphthoyl-CoA synthase [Pseudomonas aeruginosa]
MSARDEAGNAEVVLYEVQGPVALVTMNRPEYHNAQNSKMTYALDAAFRRACGDDAVKVIVLRGAGRHFSAGHDIGTPGRDVEQSFERTSLWYDHVNKPGGEFLYAREQEVYLGMCRRWREMPKPAVAMVQGACIAGGLMLAWICDLIVASDDAYFRDPVVRMGIPGVEYFAHAHELHPRIAKEFLFLGERMGAERAWRMGMVNKVVPRDVLEDVTLDMARRIAQMPRLGLQLAKQALNNAEDLMGKRATMDMVFGLHHFAHAHNELVSGDRLGGYDARAMASSQREAPAANGQGTEAQ